MFPRLCNILFELFDGIDNGSGSGELTADGILDILNADDDDTGETIDLPDADKDKAKEKGTKDKTDKETDEDTGDDDNVPDDDNDETGNEDEELEALEEEVTEDLEGVDDDKLELMTPARRRDILKKYPQLFKDFPYLERAYYREQKYTELLPTLDDAKEAIEKATILDKFENDLITGNTETVLKAVKQTDARAFGKLVDNYLPQLAKVDREAYNHVIGNFLKHTVSNMIEESRRTSDQELNDAATLLYKFVFGTTKWEAPKNYGGESPTVNPETDAKLQEVQRREREILTRQFDSARGDLNVRVNNSVKATIEANIDPKDSMTDYVKKNAVREALEDVGKLISNDNRFKVLTEKLWERAHKNGYDRASMDAIKSAYLSKAKTLLPSVIKKARIDALKGMGKRVREQPNDEVMRSKDRKGPLRPGRPASPDNNRGNNKGNVAPPKPGQSTRDYFLED